MISLALSSLLLYEFLCKKISDKVQLQLPISYCLNHLSDQTYYNNGYYYLYVNGNVNSDSDSNSESAIVLIFSLSFNSYYYISVIIYM